MVVDARFLKIKLNYQSYIPPQKKHALEFQMCLLPSPKKNKKQLLWSDLTMVFGALTSEKMFWKGLRILMLQTGEGPWDRGTSCV